MNSLSFNFFLALFFLAAAAAQTLPVLPASLGSTFKPPLPTAARSISTSNGRRKIAARPTTSVRRLKIVASNKENNDASSKENNDHYFESGVVCKPGRLCHVDYAIKKSVRDTLALHDELNLENELRLKREESLKNRDGREKDLTRDLDEKWYNHEGAPAEHGLLRVMWARYMAKLDYDSAVADSARVNLGRAYARNEAAKKDAGRAKKAAKRDARKEARKEAREDARKGKSGRGRDVSEGAGGESDLRKSEDNETQD